MTPKVTSSSSAWEVAKALYGNDQAFFDVVDGCGKNGTIICDHDVFVALLPAIIDPLKKDIEILSKKVLDNPTGYFVCIAAGKLERAIACLKPLEYIAYHRFDRKTRIVRWGLLKSVVGGK